MTPARSEACGFDHRSVILPGVFVIACSPSTRPGARVSGGGVWVVDPAVGCVVAVEGPPPVGPDAGGGDAGGGGGGLEASAAPTPAQSDAPARQAAANARSPMLDLEIPTSTATFEPEMSITSSLLQPENASSCASPPPEATGSTLQSGTIIPREGRRVP